MPKKQDRATRSRAAAREPSYQRLVKILLGQIMSQDLAAGAKLPEERVLASLHGVSRSTVRNAMQVLEARGLVNRVPSKGTFVVGTPGQARWYSNARSILLVQWSAELLPPDCYYGRICTGVRQMASSLGMELRIESIMQSVCVPLSRYVAPVASQIGGVIVCGMIDERYISMYCSEGVPVVVVDYRPQRSDVDCIETDVESEASDILRHLSERGHASMGLIALGRRQEDGLLVPDPDVRRLLDSLRRGSSSHRIQVPDEWVVTVPDLHEPQPPILSLLASNARPTALLCFHEDLVAPLLDAMATAGFRCPQDISVIGRNAPTADGRAVTHLASEPEFMGRSAVRLLLERIKSPQSPYVKLAVASRLVRGKTTGPAPV